MSKEERIQQIANGVRLFRKYRTMDGSPISEGMFALDDIESLLSELSEPQTVAEPTVWREANGYKTTRIRLNRGEELVDSNFHLTPEEFDEALAKYAETVHSPVPDTKGLEESTRETIAHEAGAIVTMVLLNVDRPFIEIVGIVDSIIRTSGSPLSKEALA